MACKERSDSTDLILVADHNAEENDKNTFPLILINKEGAKQVEESSYIDYSASKVFIATIMKGWPDIQCSIEY